MDPFRDELHNARQRIASLEREVAELRSALESARHPKTRAGRGLEISLAFLAAALCIAGSLTLVLGHRFTRVVSAEGSFPGVAIAPPPATAPESPSAAGRYADTTPCKCLPGDPLCSCACAPPFVVDDSGHRHFKPECLPSSGSP